VPGIVDTTHGITNQERITFMIPGFHGLDLVVILVIALLIFGPKRLPEMGSSIGKSIKEFRKGMSELSSPKDEKEEEVKLPPVSVTRNEFQNTTIPNDTEVRSNMTTSSTNTTESRVE
jgi:sec-independent protein translocase protein TatA